MNDSDFPKFAEAWSAAYELCSRGKLPSDGALNLAFEALRPYPIAEISAALTRHVRSADDGRFGLVPADVVKQIDGTTPSPDQIIGAALNPTTPLAVLCRSQIGTWNLANWDRHKLRPLAEQCIASIPEWRERIARGRLTDHERGLLEKYRVDPGAAQLTTTKKLGETTQ